jgi:myosin heavy subunit
MENEPGFADFVLLPQLSHESILENIKQRYQKDRIYVDNKIMRTFIV